MEFICNKCNVAKNKDKFYSRKEGKFGIERTCKICRNSLRKNPETRNKANIRQKLWAKNNPEIIKIRNKSYKERFKKELKSKRHQRLEKSPWIRNYNYARRRCLDESQDGYSYYGGKGIKFLMTINDFKFLWFRDKAYLMNKPSIDRENSKGNYELSNCRFMELVDNIRRKQCNN